jgi:hypothetical protein
MQGHNKLQTLTMIRRPHFFLTLGHRVWELAWGLTGAPFLLWGLWIGLSVKAMRIFYVYLAAILIYFLIVAEGQLDAPYRQLNAVPVLSVFLALGVVSLCGFVVSRWRGDRGPQPSAAAISAILMIVLASAVSYVKLLRSNYDQPAHPFAWTLAQEMKKDSSPRDRVIMLGEYDVHVGGNDLSPVTYYYSGLRGWTLQPRDFSMERVEDLIHRGATLFALSREFEAVDLVQDAAARDLVQKIKTKYELLYENNGQMIVRLARN